jgi:hypothetical protein
MGIPLPLGLDANIPPPVGDLANEVASWVMSGVGPGPAMNIYGAFNAVAYATVNDALTTTAASSAFTVAAGDGIAVGSSVNGVNVPPGTTVKTFAGTAGTFAFPVYGLGGTYTTNAAQITAMVQTNYLVGATIVHPDWPVGTTVTGIVQPFVQGPGGARTLGIVSTSQKPLNNSPRPGHPLGGNGRNRIYFQLTNSGVTAGTDAAAVFSGPTIEFVGTLELERSFDAGATWVTCNIGGGGQLAQYSAGTPVSFIAGECERGVAYRWNCTAYTSGSITTRISTTGQAATTIGLNATV